MRHQAIPRVRLLRLLAVLPAPATALLAATMSAPAVARDRKLDVGFAVRLGPTPA